MPTPVTFAAHPSAVRTARPADPQTLARNNAQALNVSKQFESIFLMQVLENMSSGLGTDPMFGGGAGDEIYRSMFNEQTAGAIANKGGVGIADSVYRSILQMQEVSR
jgi:flagellar protein FlgJ